ncbi:MAG: glutamyl-tRNA reductase [Bacteroidetes bacterium]|nr:glutamyl-tRNA reductase [Bacteroidota bacterium]
MFDQVQQKDINTFFVAGINYKKTDAALRGQFAISTSQYANILAAAPSYGINELFVISTCNRTEMYGFADSADAMCELICTQTEGTLDTFREIAYIKSGKEAILHLFNVAAGLDSQILGDYEILGQLKQAVKFAKEQRFIGVYLERMINTVLQASKLIKTNTELSGGTVSVSFAAIQFIKEHVADIPNKKIVLIGTGKIGRNTCKNVVDYLETKNITLINRTETKAAELAQELGLQYAPIEALDDQLATADIILVATNSVEPVILESHLRNQGNKVIIDMSIPCNVETAAQELHNTTFVNVDDLSKIKDATLHKREAEVPKAKAIINEQVFEFLEWHEMRKNAPALKSIKNKLQAMHNCDLYISYIARQNATTTTNNVDVKIQKVVNGMAVKMRQYNQRGCNYIAAINEFIATGTN